MKTTTPYIIITLGSLLLLASGNLKTHGTVINEDFASGTLPGTLEITGANFVTFSGGNALFNGAPIANAARRTYVRTIAKDFYTSDFIAEVTRTSNTDIAFFGMGAGSPNPGVSNEPVNPSINLRLHANSLASGGVDASDNGALTTFGFPGSGTDRLRLTWNATAKTARFEIDLDYAGGSFVADLTSPVIDGSNNGLSDANTSIFFGGQDSIAFDNFTVNSVPEPSSVVLLLSSALLCLRRRSLRTHERSA